MSKTEILRKLKQSFIDGDNEEPFLNREYAEETFRIFDLLIGGFDLGGNQTNNAIQDIVNDIFKYFDETDELERLVKKKIKKGNKNGDLHKL